MGTLAFWAMLGTAWFAVPADAIDPLVIEAPTVVAGDRWEFAGTRDGKPSTLSITVLEREADGRIRLEVDRTGKQSVEHRDGTMSYLFGGRLDRPQRMARYPLKVGERWTFERRTDKSDRSYAGDGRVVARRMLTVPAGTFDCLEVEASASFSMGAALNSDYRSTRWYCPAVKWFAQEKFRATTTNAYNPKENGKFEGEMRLVKFTPGKP